VLTAKLAESLGADLSAKKVTDAKARFESAATPCAGPPKPTAD
jgi:hypothetical protein